MTEQENGTIRRVVWSEIFPWLKLVRAFRVAIAARCLVFGAIGVTLTATGWALIASLFGAGGATMCSPDGGSHCPVTALMQMVDDRPVLLASDVRQVARTAWRPKDSIAYPWIALTEPVRCGLAAYSITPAAVAAVLLDGLWAAAVWALFGAAICRTAAVTLAADEQVGWATALRFAWRKWPGYFAAPLLPVGGVLLLALPVLVLGWIMNVGVFLFLGAFLWPLVLVAGFMMTLLLIGVLFGWPLMWGTISAEGTDSFDALSRSYAYTFQRPLNYLFYAAVAGLIGWLGWLLVREFAAGVVWMSYWAASWGLGQGPIEQIRGHVPLTGAAGLGAELIRFFAGCVKLLAVGYLFSYFWAASAAIYFQLRRDVDATETDEVFLDADATEPSPELPAITKDEAGAPVVAGDAGEAEKPEGNGVKGAG